MRLRFIRDFWHTRSTARVEAEQQAQDLVNQGLALGQQFKYRLAYIFQSVCVLRFNNEADKGDHFHYGDAEVCYKLSTPEASSFPF